MSKLGLSDTVARLIAQRRASWASLEELAAVSLCNIDTLLRVERAGVHASLDELAQYADALGMSVTLRCVTPLTNAKQYRSCATCGTAATWHPQLHLPEVDACVDDGIAPLILALYGVGIKTSLSCEGHDDGRADNAAYLVLDSLEDARAFFALVDRGSGGLRLRAGLRDATAADIVKGTGTSWRHSVRWHVQLGSLLADAAVSVRFDPSDIEELTKLAWNPPAPPLASLIRAARPSS